MRSKPVELTIDKIFEKDQYIIPLYQRNYSWGEAQITQLIRDVWDKAEQGQGHYYIGTLVVHKRQSNNYNHFETIDGQQRLTTLNILISVLKNNFGYHVTSDYAYKLNFDSRKKSSDTLKYLESGCIDKPSQLNSKMEQAYYDMRKEIKSLANSSNNLTIQEFIEYLTTKVVLLRVEVPSDTDLNHYFEIMNNRGEQLEKHEVLKAMFLKYLEKDENARKAFSKIWDACSNMERYIQYGFNKELRIEVFGSDWNNLPVDFKHIENSIEKIKTKKEEELSFKKMSFSSLLKNESLKFDNETGEKEKEIRFNSPINFPNFLLHVLRIHLQKDIPLDDKRLIPAFKKELKIISANGSPTEFVKDFGYSLLKCKFLFDNYIIKREYVGEKDNWSLKRIKLGEKKTPYYANSFEEEKQNKQCLMLLSMFHVSFPQIIYKHWLNGVLNYLYYCPNVDAVNYIDYLESLSEAFYFDRFINEPVDYYEIIFKNKSIPVNTEINQVFLHKGTDVQNYIFNRLDYLIWRNQVIENREDFRIGNISEFEFSFRSSVEHFYPQNPKPGADLVKEVSKDMLDNFGNLCLISRSKNSELSNYSPKAKAEHYSSSNAVESLKQQLMIKEKDNWNETAINDHEDKMIELLNEKINKNSWKNTIEENRSVETI